MRYCSSNRIQTAVSQNDICRDGFSLQNGDSWVRSGPGLDYEKLTVLGEGESGEYLGSTKYIHQMNIIAFQGEHTVTVVDTEGNTLSVRFFVK